MSENKDQLVTIIGSAYFQPIADLIENIVSHKKPEQNQVQVGYYENGYSVSAILLLVTMFESYMMRVRYLNRDDIPINRIPVSKYLKELYSDYDKFNELTEAFIVRDVIAHNHLWEIDFTWTDDPVMTLNNADKEPTAGDPKYRLYVDIDKMITINLKMNVNPIKINRSDVLKVFDIVWSTMAFLEEKNRDECFVSHIHVKYKRERWLFGHLRQELKDAL